MTYLPSANHGQIIFTTRDKRLCGMADGGVVSANSGIKVEPLEIGDATELLLEMAGRERLSEEDDGSKQELVTMLGSPTCNNPSYFLCPGGTMNEVRGASNSIRKVGAARGTLQVSRSPAYTSRRGVRILQPQSQECRRRATEDGPADVGAFVSASQCW